MYSNTSKVMVDVRSSSPLLYLPLDKLIQQVSESASAPVTEAASAAPRSTTVEPAPSGMDARSRDSARGRERETR